MELSGDGRFDVIIIGAGIMGSCAAYEVAKRGCRPLLLEQFDFLHHLGSSHGESRTIRATYPEPYYCPLVLQAYGLWEDAESEIGYQVVTRTPQLDVGPESDKSLQAVISTCRSLSIPVRVLGPAELAGEFGSSFRIPEGWVGVSAEFGGIIKPTKALAMYQSLAIKRGAVLKDHMQVVDISADHGNGGGVWVTAASGHRYWGRKCIVTAGAWTKNLVMRVSGLVLPIQPLHTTICYWKVKDGFERLLSPEGGFPTFASYGETYVYGTPSMEFPGLIKIALHGGNPCDPDRRKWGSGASSGTMVEAVARWIELVMADRVEGGKPVLVQDCMYSMTPDGDFVIDFLGGEFGKDVVVAGGFSGHGFKMGPAIGRMLAEMAIDGAAVAAAEAMGWFRVGRFEEDPKGNAKEYDEQVSSQFVDH